MKEATKEKLKRLLKYALSQLTQASTWRGIILILTGLGAHVNPEASEAIVTFGLMAAGAVGAIFPDVLNK